MKFKLRHQETGSFLAFAAVLSIAMMLGVVSISYSLKSSANETVYLSNMTKTYRLAETGLNHALGLLAASPDAYTKTANPGALFGPDAIYRSENNQASYTHDAIAETAVTGGGFYITTKAHRIVGGKTYNSNLYTYARVSNAAEYFWAVKGELQLARGTDAGQGKVYAGKLKFLTGGSGTTKVKTAEYYAGGIDPAPATSGPENNYGTGKVVEIGGNDSLRPELLTSSLVFPDVLSDDITNFSKLAHYDDSDPDKRQVMCNVTGNIFPPGYSSNSLGVTDPNLSASYHTTNAADHVYYCPGDLTIGGATIFGQVLFVAGGNIDITGDIKVYNTAIFGTNHYLGSEEQASKAHQAVLISRGNITVKHTFTNPNAPADPPYQLRTIQALILAPNGHLSSETYDYLNAGDTDNDTIGDGDELQYRLRLQFTGSIIVGQIENGNKGFRHVFNCGDTSTPVGVSIGACQPGLARTYIYMDSLETAPPPYLPAISNIIYSFEDTDQVSVN